MGAGQFSIVCVGLLCLQFMLQAKGRGIAAGICWAFAMVKPQIALPFAFVLVVEKNWRGLFAGSALLAALSLFALFWTGLGIWDFLRTGPLMEGMDFVKDTPYAAGLWINALGISPQIAVAGAVLLLCLIGFWGISFLGHKEIPALTAAAYCSALGYALFYHRRYDNMMLFPLALALALVFFKRGFSALEWVVYGAFFVSVFLPAGIISEKAPPELLALTAPVAAALLLFLSNRQWNKTRPIPKPTTEAM